VLKLLIADDEETIREGLYSLIDSFHLELQLLEPTDCGRMAETIIRREQPEILLLDINMPGKNGLELAETALKLNPEAKVVLVTGYDEFSYAQKALRLGVSDYLLKPVNRALLYQTLIRIMEQYRNRCSELERLQRSNDVDERALEESDPVSEAINILQCRYSDPSLSLSMIADEIHVSDSQLSRGIKKRTGKTFTDYLMQIRIEQAAFLLREKRNIMLYNIAASVGFSSQHYFCKMFRQYMDCSPGEYREKKQNT